MEGGDFNQGFRANEEDFIHLLDYSDCLASIYHFNPSKYHHFIDAYKESSGWSYYRRTLRTEEEHCVGGIRIVWKYKYGGCRYESQLKPKFMLLEKAAKRINNNRHPVVININLNALQYLNRKMTKEAGRAYGHNFRNVFRDCIMGVATRSNVDTEMYQNVAACRESYSYEPEAVDEATCSQRAGRIRQLFGLIERPDLIFISRSQDGIPTVPPERVDYLESLVKKELYERKII